ncbi:hypothetical protein [Actinomadura xylanilytica]|uniref:hypothetical protein n=1 Tax=Actinomadura xylanilytica TaxID=887459 RepID=UPI00255AB041|nr:hypothetical protein [Actinomadura xylanilytica]MDL4775316.1 hypothetical protein [Actinomadura xylanilytica]
MASHPGNIDAPQRADDLVTRSPDGESRGLMARVGDLFPLNPIGNVLSRTDASASPARPWGLRFLSVPQPRAGKHEGGTNETSGDPDGNKPGEERSKD